MKREVDSATKANYSLCKWIEPTITSKCYFSLQSVKVHDANACPQDELSPFRGLYKTYSEITLKEYLRLKNAMKKQVILESFDK